MKRVRVMADHELHHVARERGPGCGTSLRERIVSEGLAMLFEEQIFGVASEIAHVDIADNDIEKVFGCLDQDHPAGNGRWFFHSGDVPLWFGYTIGYRWAKRYAAKHGLRASDLAHAPAALVAARL